MSERESESVRLGRARGGREGGKTEIGGGGRLKLRQIESETKDQRDRGWMGG